MSAKQNESQEKLLENRAIGCLLGQAVGDALGTRYEFGNSKNTKSKIAKDIDADNHLPILGQGPFNVVPGQVTDDTELALALARSLVRKGTFDIYDIAQSYVTWFNSPPFDIGATTSTAFRGTNPKINPEENYARIQKNSAEGNQKSLSNGCLMRISPLAITGVRWTEENLQMAAKMDCELTNPNPIALEAVAVYVTAIRTAILTGDIKQTYESALSASSEDGEIRKLLMAAQKQPEPILLSNGKAVSTDSQYQGYLGVALQNTFYELLNTNDFEKALVNIISRGGDTDTNGAIAGALLGAIYGYESIPYDWTETVLTAKTEQRQEQYPDVDTSDLIELAVLLLGFNDNHIAEPFFKDEFDEHVDEDEEGEEYNEDDEYEIDDDDDDE